MAGAGSSAPIGTTTQVLKHVKLTRDQLSEASPRLKFPKATERLHAATRGHFDRAPRGHRTASERNSSGRDVKMRLAAINALDRDAFVARLGSIFEHSSWVAAAAWDVRPFASTDALHAAMVAAVDRAGEARQLELL